MAIHSLTASAIFDKKSKTVLQRYGEQNEDVRVEKIDVNTVYILGAGASHDLSFQNRKSDGACRTRTPKYFLVEGPLSSGYFYYFNQILKTVEDNCSSSSVTVNAQLLAYICKKYGITKDKLFENKKLSQKINIENLYIDIENATDKMKLKCGGSPNYLSYLRNDLKSYIFDTLSFIGYYCISKFHRIFAEHIINAEANVISFNWDTLLDEALFNTNCWSCKIGYGFEFKRIIYKNAKNAKIITPTKAKNVVLLKPHGSINWYSDNWYSDMGKDKLYLIVPVKLSLRGGTFGQLKSCESIDKDHYVYTCIIPPGKKRKQFPLVWDRIKDILQNADKIISIGFSFNSNDSHVKDEFESIGFKKDVAIEIIDPNGSKLVNIYKEVFKTKNINVKCSLFADYCKSLTPCAKT